MQACCLYKHCSWLPRLGLGRARSAVGVVYGLGWYIFVSRFLILRSFIPTTLTEPIGFFWALLAIPFVIGGLRKGSWPLALLGLAFTSVALMTRMGAMFLMPMMSHYGCCGASVRLGLQTLGLAAAIVAVFAAVIGANFAIEGAIRT